MKLRVTTALLMGTGLLLAACDSSDTVDGSQTDVDRAANSFGSAFSTAFRAGTNDGPSAVSGGDLTLTPNADPVDF
ncbi:hypothetical protein [Profundibacterium mesophilum]|uniref:Prokaryotic membrane lipoprotein lipid attachment site domain containing protein n=1 Tax=Profundibacterium mesophilum KAUST100406-0324 TaxID=1037889 RepID=A0A921NUJ7_9RHOB|nr:hypothetical protein [Profundibacterium mesophilum]KAF0675828.1 Prokaryotic membrane lipoprotein lipid attachment site domain containing protein [Profundibacterium mesophilum KAUST100406-0324]